MRLAFDLETYSPLELKRVGAWRLSIHPRSDVLCAAMTDETGKLILDWKAGDPAPTFEPGTIFTGYNVLAFDAIWWLHVLTPRYGWPWPGFQAFEDTMHRAAYGNLPGALGEVARALGTAPKDKAGHDLMMYLCKPAPAIKADEDPRRHHTVENIAALRKYCIQDTIAEHQVSRRVPKLPAIEQRVASLDAEINRRGIRVNLDLIEHLTNMAAETSDTLRVELERITDGAVRTERQHEPLRQWLRAHGVPVRDGKGSMDKEAIGDLLAMNTWPDDVDRALNLRLMLNKSSLAKLEKMAECVDPRDGRIHGLLQYYGAHQTGRWAGRLVQPQNLPRGVLEGKNDAETLALYEQALWILQHAPSAFDMTYGDDAMDVLSSLIRCCFVPGPGNLLVCADYAAIEARVLAWLAGEEWRLDVFRTHGKIYEASASKAFGVPMAGVTKKLRGGGKVLELACCEENQLVLTDRGEVPIRDVRLTDLVWDGVDWVEHEGIVFQGTREVITYGSLTATPDHQVWIHGQSGPVGFGVAAANGSPLLKTGSGRQAFRVGGDPAPGRSVHATRMADAVRSDPMLRVQLEAMDMLGLANAGSLEGLSDLQPAEGHPGVVGPKANGGAAAMHEPEGSWIRELRRQGHSVCVPFDNGGGEVGAGEPGITPGAEHRQNRQRGALRAREPVLVDASREQHEPTEHTHVDGNAGVVRDECALRGDRCEEVCQDGDGPGGDRSAGSPCSGREAEGLAKDNFAPRFARVYDIRNAGPRNRYTVSGVLVHNCGFGGSTGALRRFGAVKRYGMTEDALKPAVDAWREASPNIVQHWYDLENAAMSSLRNPGKVHPVGDKGVRFGFDGRHLRMRLPSGRELYYRDAYIGKKEVPWSTQPKDAIMFYGENEDGYWGLQDTYGGRLSENDTSATSRDLLAEAMLRVDDAGIPIVMTVHDEVVSEMPEDKADPDELCRLMSILPSWAEGLPVTAAGWAGSFYRK